MFQVRLALTTLTAVTIALSTSLLAPNVTLATPPPTAQEVAEAMRGCLPIVAIEPSTPTGGIPEYWITVDGMPETFAVSTHPSNSESYNHWWNVEVTLIFTRYPPTVEPPAPEREIRDWRNRTIRCFFSAPAIPEDFARYPSEIFRTMAACLTERIGATAELHDLDVGYRYQIDMRLQGDPSAPPGGTGFRPHEDAVMSIDLMSEWNDPGSPTAPTEHVVPYWWGVTPRYAIARQRGWVTPELEQATDECLAVGVHGR